MLRIITIALVTAAVLAACGPRDKKDSGKRQASTCVDGQVESCECPGGTSGQRACLEDTNVFGDCDCTAGAFDGGSLDVGRPNVGVDSGRADLGSLPDLATSDAGTDTSASGDLGGDVGADLGLDVRVVDAGTDSGVGSDGGADIGSDLGSDMGGPDAGAACDALLTIQGGSELAATTARSLTLTANVPAGTSVTWQGATLTADPLVTTLDIASGGMTVVLSVGPPYDCVVRRSFYVVPAQGIAVALEWDTPSDADQFDFSGTDVDIHLLHPSGMWNNAPWDLFWNNPAPDWGVMASTADDPSLVLDDTDGAGPELVTLELPEATNTYEVGVYYYADSGYGPSDAWIYVFVDGQFATRLDAQLQTTGTFWHAASVAWPSGTVTDVSQLYTGFP